MVGSRSRLAALAVCVMLLAACNSSQSGGVAEVATVIASPVQVAATEVATMVAPPVQVAATEVTTATAPPGPAAPAEVTGAIAPPAPVAATEVASPHIVSEEEALRTDAQNLIDRYGVEPDEAVRRIGWQTLAGELGAAVERAYEGSLAGVWVEQTPVFRLVIWVKEGTEQSLQIPAGTPFPVDFRNDATYSRDELVSVAREAASDVSARIGEPVGFYVDAKANRAVVEVFDGLRAEHEAALEALLASRPVDVRWTVGRAGPD